MPDLPLGPQHCKSPNEDSTRSQGPCDQRQRADVRDLAEKAAGPSSEALGTCLIDCNRLRCRVPAAVRKQLRTVMRWCCDKGR